MNEYLIIQLPNGFTMNGRIEPQPDGGVVIHWQSGWDTRHSAESWLRISAQSIDLRNQTEHDKLSASDTD